MIDKTTIRRGDLVLTNDGYRAIVESVQGKTILLFLGNGLRADYSLDDVEIVPLKDGAESAANFAEIMR